MSSSMRFPSSDADSISRTRFKRTPRVPDDRDSNRHIACVGENDAHKITLCSSVVGTYTTVTFKPATGSFRHSDAAAVFPSRPLPPLEEEDGSQSAVGVDGKTTKSSIKKMLKQKVQQLLRSDSTSAKGISSSSISESFSSSSNFSTTFAAAEPVTPSRKGSSLFHFGRARNGSNASKAATIGFASASSNRSNLTLNLLASENTSVRRPRQTQTRAVRRSRSFNDADRFALAASLALEEAARELSRDSPNCAARGPVLRNGDERHEMEDALERAARGLADGIRHSRRMTPDLRHLFAKQEWEEDDKTLGRNSPEDDLDDLLDEATEEARQIAELIGDQDGWMMDEDGHLVREVYRPLSSW